MKQCPNCKSLNVRRSALHNDDDPSKTMLRSPYRCRDCRERFWVISRRTYIRATVVVAINLAFGLLIAAYLITFSN